MKLLYLNNKCFLNLKETLSYKKELEKMSQKNIEIVLFPNILYLSNFSDSKISIGAQNFYSYNKGAYTGEISLEALKEIGVTHTLVGHPERINLGLDRYDEIKDKLFKSINSNFKTVLCIGKDSKKKTIKKELKYYLKGIEYKALKNLVIAFEPEDKIEDGYVEIDEIIKIRNYVKKYMSRKYEEDIPFIYGGSVNKENAKEVLDVTDGVLIGKSSKDIKEIKEIIKQI